MQKGFLVFERLVNAISHGLKSFSYCFLFLIVLVINIFTKNTYFTEKFTIYFTPIYFKRNDFSIFSNCSFLQESLRYSMVHRGRGLINNNILNLQANSLLKCFKIPSIMVKLINHQGNFLI